jgi:hypothetical protein
VVADSCDEAGERPLLKSPLLSGLAYAPEPALCSASNLRSRAARHCRFAGVATVTFLTLYTVGFRRAPPQQKGHLLRTAAYFIRCMRSGVFGCPRGRVATAVEARRRTPSVRVPQGASASPVRASWLLTEYAPSLTNCGGR